MYSEKTEEVVMITSEDKVYVMGLVKKLTPDILKEIHFDSTTKEPGHSYHGPFEAKLVEKLLEIDGDFGEATRTRSSDDILYKGNYINIKFGYKKNGQPNICSMHRLFKYLHEDKIDSYYILSVDANGPVYQFFDVYDYLDYTNFNYGTGQLMLCESKMKGVYKFNDKFLLTKKDKIIVIGNMMRKECGRHIELKKKQQVKIDRITDEYKQGNLQQLCAA